jgi:tetratricopeptide (TPR) repeat protein/transcriptional regulator with XRE-family HTH domain
VDRIEGFGAQLRSCRVAAGLTQEELAHQAGLSERTIRNLERGTAQPHMRSVDLLAGTLGLSGASRDAFARAARSIPGQPAGSDAPGEAGTPAGTGPVPRQLPAAVPDFTGRSAELKALADLLEAGGREPGTVLISAIGGTAGVGKTALAVHWAHEVADRFPDGQLYVNLRGYDPDRPIPPAEALAGFLRAMGLKGPEIPPGEDERAARYRTLLAGRRVLVLLDNAGSAEQARPLLPASPSCVAVVTSRDALTGLVAREGARRVELDLLSPRDARALLANLIGDRAAADPTATATLAEQCYRLPLALRVAAELAIARGGTPLAELAGELADQQRRLDLLEAGGDPRTALRAVFSWSYQHLSDAAARAFRLGSLHPGSELDRYTLAALTGTTVREAAGLLGQLARAHLVQPAAPGYGPYDLLRAYARELCLGHDGEAGQRAALTRLFDQYVHTAVTAANLASPADRARHPVVPPPAVPGPPLTEAAGALAWLDAQVAALVAVASHTATHGWPRHTVQLASALYRYLNDSGRNAEGLEIFTHALRAAEEAQDRPAEAEMVNGLASFHLSLGHSQQATGYYERSIALYRELGDRTGEARVLSNLGVTALFQGRYAEAIAYLERSLALFQALGNQIATARSLENLGISEGRLDRHRQSVDHSQESLTLMRKLDNQAGEARVLAHLGETYLRQGQGQQAAEHCQQALAVARSIANRPALAVALANLGDVELWRGRYQQATDHYQESLVLEREISQRPNEARVLNHLGAVLLATGRPWDARAQYTEALDLATQIGHVYEQARAHDGLGQSARALGDPGQARRHWHEALTLHTGIGTSEADQVRARLAALGPRSVPRAGEPPRSHALPAGGAGDQPAGSRLRQVSAANLASPLARAQLQHLRVLRPARPPPPQQARASHPGR